MKHFVLRTTLNLAVILSVVFGMVSLSPDWVRPRAVMAAPLTQQGIGPIRDPQSCVPAGQGGVFINFDDLPNGTHVAEQYAPLGVHFVDSRVTTPLIYGNILERTTSSMPNSLTNDADSPNTSEGVPLAMWFDAPQTTIGFFMGNGGQGITPTATIRAYSDVTGTTFLGSVNIAVQHNDVNLFYGVTSLTGATIMRVELDYGKTLLSEEIDDLCFSRSRANPPPHTFTGRVLTQSGPLATPAGVGGVLITLYGSNDATLGTPLIETPSALSTGQFTLTTSMVYLRYTLVEGTLPKGYCYVKAVPGAGGAATDKNRIQYSSPMPGTHPNNEFYLTSGQACNPRPVVTDTVNALPFLVPLQVVAFLPLTDTDLRATRIEVNQSIQDDVNSVPQVLEKWTVVRVYVTSGSSSTINNVLVRLHVFLNGVEKAVVNTRARAVPSPQRVNKDDSANFYIAAYNGTDSTVGFYAEVDPTNEVFETNNANNRYPSVGTQNHAFFKRQNISVAYAPIHYNWSGWGGAQNPTSRINAAVDWMRSLYPLPNLGPRSAMYYPYPGFTFNKNVDVYDYELISRLNYRWLLSSWGLAPLGWLFGVDLGASSNQLYGWLPDGAYGGNGLSDPTWYGGLSHVGFGNDKPDKYRRTMAHEIGHNLGLCHNNRFINTIGFDVLLNQVVKDTTFRDFMWPARREDEAWIDTTNYNRIFNWLAPGASVPAGLNSCLTLSAAAVDENYIHGPAAPLAPSTVISGAHEFAFIGGSVSITHTGTLEPIYRDIRNAADLPDATGSDYCVAMVNSSDEVIAQYCFSPDFDDPGDGLNPRSWVSFGFPMLWNPSTAKIELRYQTTVLDSQNVSANTPVVTVTAPNGGENFAANANIPIGWTATDADNDPLTYNVFYSPDGGATWIPAADGLTTTSVLLPASSVAGSNNALVRVMASDGANTGVDQSDAAFTVEPKPPQVFITAPISGTLVPISSTVPLVGIGIDLEDGSLDGTSLQWTSSKDGALGSGPSPIVSPLSPGQHTLTLTGTDSDGNSVATSIQLFAGTRVYLPIVLK